MLCFGGLRLLLPSYSCLIFFIVYGKSFYLFSQSLIASFIKVSLRFDIFTNLNFFANKSFVTTDISVKICHY